MLMIKLTVLMLAYILCLNLKYFHKNLLPLQSKQINFLNYSSLRCVVDKVFHV